MHIGRIASISVKGLSPVTLTINLNLNFFAQFIILFKTFNSEPKKNLPHNFLK